LLEPISNATDVARLRKLIERHVSATASAHAKTLLDTWDDALPAFWKVIPRAAFAIQNEAEPEAVTAEPSRGVAD
jgi:glutamate synthase domain-containing protein 3